MGRQNQLYGWFFLIIFWSSLLTGIRSSVSISNPREFWVSFSMTDSGLCIYYLVVLSNFNFLQDSQSITFPPQSCQVFFSFCVSLLHTYIMYFNGFVSIITLPTRAILSPLLCFHFNVVGLLDIDLKISLTSVDGAAEVGFWLDENNNTSTRYLE